LLVVKEPMRAIRVTPGSWLARCMKATASATSRERIELGEEGVPEVDGRFTLIASRVRAGIMYNPRRDPPQISFDV
jgi:hypothetical protein